MTRRRRHLIVVAATGLLWLGVADPGWGAGGEPQLHVSSHPPQLSVEAQGVSLQQVLQAIGTEVGFTVVDRGGSRAPLTLSLTDATLAEVLRQLLRGENYAILYRGPKAGNVGGGIDKITLLGPQTAPSAAFIPALSQ